MTEYPSKLIEEAVNELNRLPGIGKKTALRLALFLLRQDETIVTQFGNAFIKMRKEICYCKTCCNISDKEMCGICANPARDRSIVCIVSDITDFMAIENTGQFRGVYHVLGGVISPMDGIGPKDLTIEALINRVASREIHEVIMALKTTVEGDTTNFYIYRKLKDFTLKVTQIARGIAVGDELEYTDEITLGRSILNRVPYEQQFNH